MGKKSKAAKLDTLHVGLLLDESGSMTGSEAAVIGGVNEFVESLRKQEAGAKVRATLGMFDLHGTEPAVRFSWIGIPLEEISWLSLGDYVPRGATPLNDAVVATIRRMEKVSRDGGRTMLVILTDGLENASETPSDDLRKLIRSKEEAGWEFIYLGANQDAWQEAGRIGVSDRGKTFDFEATPDGVGAALSVSAERVQRYRAAPAEYREELSSMGDRIEPSREVTRRRR
jgi:Mg-chelatase subunit ChlD